MMASSEDIKLTSLLVPYKSISLIEDKFFCNSFLRNNGYFLQLLSLCVKNTHSRCFILETEYEFIRFYLI